MLSRILEDILSRKDPQGYYVIPARGLPPGGLPRGASAEEAGGIVLVRVKSRSLAKKLVLELHRAGLLALGEER
jgi:hypothetical protein